jgi:Ca-activated chloride channel family protein
MRRPVLSLGLVLLALCFLGVNVGADDLKLEFLYGSEKEKWITQVTDSYNQAGHTVNGKKVEVKPIPIGSGEAMEELLSGRRQAQVFSPASGLFIELGNARSRARSGKNLIEGTKTLVRSPVVIAMWKPMAEALGWPKQKIGWADVLKLADASKGWASKGHPEWGSFLFGHTHPEHSNSGLISVLAEVYAGAGVPKGQVLNRAQVENPATARFVRGIEQSIVFYGSSTGFFADTMVRKGPQALSATVLYESSVIESYDPVKYPPENKYAPVVAIYPEDGTFWSDHPVGIVTSHVDDDQRRAAEEYIDYLRARPQQVLAMATGFRPGDASIPLTAPLDLAHGVNPKAEINVRPVPQSDVMEAVLDLWRTTKRRAQVTLILDRSGSMQADQKLVAAKRGALEAIKLLGDDDRLAIILFNEKADWLVQEDLTRNVRARAHDALSKVFADGQTAIYDALKLGQDHLRTNRQADMISAIVLLSDGVDGSSKQTLESVLAALRTSDERTMTRVFTVSYGKDANKSEMELIAQRTRARSYEGTPENIRKVFQDIFQHFGPR